MPWIQIIIFILSYFLSKKQGASDGKAALIAAGVTGVATYTGLTDTIAGWFGDASTTTAGSATTATVGQTGAILPTGGGLGSTGSGTTGISESVADVLKSWGATGTAAVIGTTAVSTSSSLQKYLPYLIIGGVALLILK